MALAFRVSTAKHLLNGLFNRLCKVSKYNTVQVAHISGKLNRSSRVFPPPFPYREKDVGFFDIFDYTVERYDENSKIIVVEGPIAAGKDKFARELAKELGMAYMPRVSFDITFKDAYGNDIRTVDHTWPESIQMVDIERFLTNPKHPNAPAFQAAHYLLKLDAYVESLLHVLSTGEGVVLNRSFYSDFVFMKAMHNAGYINNRCRQFYNKMIARTSRFCMKPHLVIYLDVPVNVVKERIKKRCIPYEVNSDVLTTKYLTDIETIYKQEYLPQIENHAHLLMYDWASGGNIDDVVEDIEWINFEYDKQYPNKLKDWLFIGIADVMGRRQLYNRGDRNYILSHSLIKDFDCTEMYHYGTSIDTQDELIAAHCAINDEGYNPKMGDKVLWKNTTTRKHGYPNVIGRKELMAT